MADVPYPASNFKKAVMKRNRGCEYANLRAKYMGDAARYGLECRDIALTDCIAAGPLRLRQYPDFHIWTLSCDRHDRRKSLSVERERIDHPYDGSRRRRSQDFRE